MHLFRVFLSRILKYDFYHYICLLNKIKMGKQIIILGIILLGLLETRE
jgi:hypothetical protein